MMVTNLRLLLGFGWPGMLHPSTYVTMGSAGVRQFLHGSF